MSVAIDSLLHSQIGAAIEVVKDPRAWVPMVCIAIVTAALIVGVIGDD